MTIRDFFKHGSAGWLKYDSYEYRSDKSGTIYLTPSGKAKPDFYDPLETADQIIADAVNIGLAAMREEDDSVLKDEVLTFTKKYGLLGLMTALPTTADFIEYEKVYLPKNHFIREESMTTRKYLSCFFPLEKPELQKRGKESVLNITDKTDVGIAIATQNDPQAVTMTFLHNYAERYDWIVTVFRDLAFTLTTSFLYYQDKDRLEEEELALYRQGMAAFGGIAPTYHIELREKPVIVWDFHSLSLILQMMLSFMIADESPALKLCKKCGKAFLPTRKNSEFCSARCKNQYNVYKTRAKKQSGESDNEQKTSFNNSRANRASKG